MFSGEDAIITQIIENIIGNVKDPWVLITVFVCYLIYKTVNAGVKKAPIVPNTVEEVVSTVVGLVPGLNIITKLFGKK